MERNQISNYRLLSFTIGILLIAGNLFAKQVPQHRPPALPDSTQIIEIVEEMDRSLSLTEEQKAAISNIHFHHFEEAKELMEEHKGDREEHRQAMNDLREDFEEQVKDILTDDQIPGFEEFMADQMKRHGKNRPGHK